MMPLNWLAKERISKAFKNTDWDISVNFIQGWRDLFCDVLVSSRKIREKTNKQTKKVSMTAKIYYMQQITLTYMYHKDKF